MQADFPRPEILPARLRQTPPPEREGGRGRGDGSRSCPGSARLRSRGEDSSRKTPILAFPRRFKRPREHGLLKVVPKEKPLSSLCEDSEDLSPSIPVLLVKLNPLRTWKAGGLKSHSAAAQLFEQPRGSPTGHRLRDSRQPPRALVGPASDTPSRPRPLPAPRLGSKAARVTWSPSSTESAGRAEGESGWKPRNPAPIAAPSPAPAPAPGCSPHARRPLGPPAPISGRHPRSITGSKPASTAEIRGGSREQGHPRFERCPLTTWDEPWPRGPH